MNSSSLSFRSCYARSFTCLRAAWWQTLKHSKHLNMKRSFLSEGLVSNQPGCSLHPPHESTRLCFCVFACVCVWGRDNLQFRQNKYLQKPKHGCDKATGMTCCKEKERLNEKRPGKPNKEWKYSTVWTFLVHLKWLAWQKQDTICLEVNIFISW